jgi:hypothetical protein
LRARSRRTWAPAVWGTVPSPRTKCPRRRNSARSRPCARPTGLHNGADRSGAGYPVLRRSLLGRRPSCCRGGVAKIQNRGPQWFGARVRGGVQGQLARTKAADREGAGHLEKAATVLRGNLIGRRPSPRQGDPFEGPVSSVSGRRWARVSIGHRSCHLTLALT